VFLASGMVPAYTAAAFVKRLARLALGAPPGGAQLALAFMHNVLRRHPAAMQLLHRPPRGGLAGVAAAAAAPPPPAPLLPLPPEVVGGGGAAGQPLPGGAATAPEPAAPLQEEQQRQQEQDGPAWRGEDVFDLGEPDPASSRALESSLWELEALRRHSNPQVRLHALCLCGGGGGRGGGGRRGGGVA
jgi:U3 small nucleolar RNA-associated protein 19